MAADDLVFPRAAMMDVCGCPPVGCASNEGDGTRLVKGIHVRMTDDFKTKLNPMASIIFTLLLMIFIGSVAALVVRHQRLRQGKRVPAGLNGIATLGLLLLGGVCAFGFLASFEPSESALTYRLMFASIGLLSAGAAIRIGQPALRR